MATRARPPIRTLPRLVLALVAAAASAGTARAADRCDSYRTPSQVLAGLTSDQQVLRVEAKTCGLASDDRSVRGVVLAQVLQGMDTMSFDVQPQERDPDGAALVNRMPAFLVGRIIWSKDGRTFRGAGVPGQIGGVEGNFLGESLAVAFPTVALAPDKPDTRPVITSCSATLSLAKGAADIQGLLRCQGMAPRFIISMGL